jgi:hypothetical protein
MSAVCPVCGWPDLDAAPRSESGSPSFEICPSCGYEFGHSDDVEGCGYERWRATWVASGMPWYADDQPPPPEGWDPEAQLGALAEDGIG